MGLESEGLREPGRVGEEECLWRKQRCQFMKPAGDPGELSDLSRETLRSSCSVTDKDSGKIVS